MKAIDRKLIRDALAMWGQLLAICAVIGCGVAAFVMSLSALEALLMPYLIGKLQKLGGIRRGRAR